MTVSGLLQVRRWGLCLFKEILKVSAQYKSQVLLSLERSVSLKKVVLQKLASLIPLTVLRI